MNRAAFLSLQLARFDTLREAGTLARPDDRSVDSIDSGVLFCRVGADTRAAATEPASQQAFTFLILGLHRDEASAHRLLDRQLDNRSRLAPWLMEAREVWAGVLQPYRHNGAANYLDPQQPGPLFETLAPAPSPTRPLVALTSVGWNVDEQLDRNRVREFSSGVGGVRMAMTGVKGLHSQQSFFFPNVLETDPVTVTFWREEAAMVAFAYGPGVHRHQMARFRQERWADRTSFTRCVVRRSEGTWYGTDPQAG
jgi:hypothetical protein